MPHLGHVSQNCTYCNENAESLVPKSNPVDHPEYYGGKDNPYEVIKVLEAWGLTANAYLFNVVKYLSRAGKKDPGRELEDCRKAQFYLNRYITVLESKKD